MWLLRFNHEKSSLKGRRRPGVGAAESCGLSDAAPNSWPIANIDLKDGDSLRSCTCTTLSRADLYRLHHCLFRASLNRIPKESDLDYTILRLDLVVNQIHGFIGPTCCRKDVHALGNLLVVNVKGNG